MGSIFDFFMGRGPLKKAAGEQPKAKAKAPPAYDMDQMRRMNEESVRKKREAQGVKPAEPKTGPAAKRLSQHFLGQ